MQSLRNALGVIFGLISSFILIKQAERINFSLYPPPTGFDPSKPGALEELMKMTPDGALLVVIFAHFLASLIAGLVAALVSTEKRMNSAVITGAILLALGIATLIMVKVYPGWFWVADIAVYIPAAVLGGKLALRYKP